ncbi:MAG: sortase [Acidimicrobiales bacterium]
MTTEFPAGSGVSSARAARLDPETRVLAAAARAAPANRIARGFVEQLVDEAQTQARFRGETSRSIVVDLDTLWAAGLGASSPERAVGRVVLRSAELARSLAPVLDDVATGDAIGGAPMGAAPQRSGPSLEDRRRMQLLSMFSWLRNAGIVLILFAAWQVWGTGITEHHDQAALARQFSAHRTASPAALSPPRASGGSPRGQTVPLVPSSVVLPEPAESSVVARLQIPAVGVDQYVVEGTAAGDLAKGPGHYVGTSLPGQAGNVAVAGHRTTHGAPFFNLGEIVPNDVIVLTTASGETLDYVVRSAPTPVAPSDVAVLDDFGDNRITLTTCNPKFSAAQRLVVVGILEQQTAPVIPPGARPAPSGHVHAASLSSDQTSGWNFAGAPWVTIPAVLLVYLGLLYRRAKERFGHPAHLLVLGPLWALGLYLLFGALTALLPAAL